MKTIRRTPKYIRARGDSGFTLVELIITLTVAAVVGAMLVGAFQNTLAGSVNPVIIARSEGAAEQVMEQITGQYVTLINGATPATALTDLDTFVTGLTLPAGVTAVTDFVAFDASGAVVAGAEALRVQLASDGHSLAAVFTQTRTDSDDLPMAY